MPPFVHGDKHSIRSSLVAVCALYVTIIILARIQQAWHGSSVRNVPKARPVGIRRQALKDCVSWVNMWVLCGEMEAGARLKMNGFQGPPPKSSGCLL